MRQNLHITFDLSIFNGIPAFSDCAQNKTVIQREIKTPKAIIFNRVLYKVVDQKIMAFKILAWAKTLDSYITGHELSYLVQFPGEPPRWIKKFADYSVATSVEDLVNGRFIDLHSHGLIELADFRESHIYSDYCFKKSYKMMDGAVHTAKSVIKYLMGTEDGIFIGLSHPYEDCFETREQAIASKYDGMEVVDFAEPIKVEIEVQPTSAVKGILRFE